MPDLPTRLARKWAGYVASMTPEQMIAAAILEALEEAEKVVAEETYYKCKCGYVEGEGYRSSSHIAECLIRNEMHEILAAALAALREGT